MPAFVPGHPTTIKGMGTTVRNHPVKVGIGAAGTIAGAITIGLAPGMQGAGYRILAGSLAMLAGLANETCAAGEYPKCN